MESTAKIVDFIKRHPGCSIERIMWNFYFTRRHVNSVTRDAKRRGLITYDNGFYAADWEVPWPIPSMSAAVNTSYQLSKST